MRRWAVVILLFTALLCTCPSAAAAGKTSGSILTESIILKIGSHAAVVDAGVTSIYPRERTVTAYIRNDRTFVPVRFVAERLGAKVDWEAKTSTVVISNEEHVIRMDVGSKYYTVDGKQRSLDAPAEMMPSTSGYARTMVPIRFVSEALGYQVQWDEARSLVVIAPQTFTWDANGEAEQSALNEAVRLLAMYSMFV